MSRFRVGDRVRARETVTLNFTTFSCGPGIVEGQVYRVRSLASDGCPILDCDHPEDIVGWAPRFLELVGEPAADNQPYSIAAAVWPGLSKLIEECGEVAQVAGKIIGAGGKVDHWDGGPPLNERLEDEIADTMAACIFVQKHNSLDYEKIQARIREKLRLFDLWHVGDVT